MQQALFRDILLLYTKHKNVLPLEKAGHFFMRAYNATGQKRFIAPVAKHIVSSKEKDTLTALHRLDDPHFRCVSSPTSSRSINGRRNNRRKEFYKKHAHLPPFHRLANNLYFLSKTRLEKKYAHLFTAGIPLLKRHRSLISLLCSQEGILLDSSYSANTIFHLRHLGITDATERYIRTAQEIFEQGPYKNPDVLADEDFYSAFYTLTHIIIAASGFYEKRPTEQFDWIFDYFERYHLSACHRLSLDILTEIALCYRLCKQISKRREVYNYFLHSVYKKFFPVKTLPLALLEKKEHTASVALLLFSPEKHFFKGPHLATHPYFKNYER